MLIFYMQQFSLMKITQLHNILSGREDMKNAKIWYKQKMAIKLNTTSEETWNCIPIREQMEFYKSNIEQEFSRIVQTNYVQIQPWWLGG